MFQHLHISRLLLTVLFLPMFTGLNTSPPLHGADMPLVVTLVQYIKPEPRLTYPDQLSS